MPHSTFVSPLREEVLLDDLKDTRKQLDKTLANKQLSTSLKALLKSCVSLVARSQHALMARQSPALWEKYWLTLPGVIVYRVQTPQSNTELVPGEGFFAARRFTHAPTDHEFAEAVEDQMLWASGNDSPFISVFAHRRHATNWAKKWVANNPHQGWPTITALKLTKEEMVYSAAVLVDELQISTGLHPGQYHSEYLILNHYKFNRPQFHSGRTKIVDVGNNDFVERTVHKRFGG